MTPHRYLVVAVLGIGASASHASITLAQSLAPTFPGITVGPNVHVTTAHSQSEQMEFGVCADPHHTNELAIAAMYLEASPTAVRNVGVYVSHDGGTTWQLALDVPRAVDPTCAFGPDGTLYVANMSRDWPTPISNFRSTLLHTSRDGGKTWVQVATPTPLGRWLDRPWLTVDNTSGAYAGTVYFGAMEYTDEVRTDSVPDVTELASDLLVFRSHDHGATLEPATIVPSTHADRSTRATPTAAPGQMVVLSDGAVVASYIPYGSDSAKETTQRIAVSSDGAKTFSAAVPISSPVARSGAAGGHFMPMLAVDQTNGPYRDRVYAVWSSGVTGRTQLWMTYSLDRQARRWADPRVIDELPAPTPDSLPLRPLSLQPGVAVNRAGVVGVSWCASQGRAMQTYMPRFMASVDGGESWTHSVDLAPRASRTVGRLRQWLSFSQQQGYRAERNPAAWLDFASASSPSLETTDFWGLAADAAGTFHPVWIDDRTGRPQLWTAAVSVNDHSHHVRDLSGEVSIRVGDATRDSAANRVAVDVTLFNVSGKPLRGPFFLQWVAPESLWGPPPDDLVATNAENGWAGAGAVWTLRARGASGVLGPNELTAPASLAFRTRQADAGAMTDQMPVRVFIRAE